MASNGRRSREICRHRGNRHDDADCKQVWAASGGPPAHAMALQVKNLYDRVLWLLDELFCDEEGAGARTRKRVMSCKCSGRPNLLC
jgi:hypothetical protein